MTRKVIAHWTLEAAYEEGAMGIAHWTLLRTKVMHHP